MLINIVDVVGAMLEIVLAVNFFGVVMNRKEIETEKFIAVIIGCMITQSIAITLLKEQLIINTILIILLYILTCMYKSTIQSRVIYVFVLMVLYMLSEVLVGICLSFLTGESVEILSKNILYYMQGVLISKLIMIALINIIGLYSYRTSIKLSRSFILPFVMLPLTTFMVSYVMSEFMYKSSPGRIMDLAVVAVTTLIFSNLIVFYIYEHQIRLTEIHTKETMLNKNLEQQLGYYKELSERQNISNKSMHDLKNKIFSLKELIENNPDKGLEEISNICDEVVASYSLKYTHIPAVDSLISAKMQIMEHNNIKFNCNVYIPENNSFDSMDMCILLGSLLDNAIEANQKIKEERYIRMIMKQNMSYLSIVIENPVCEEVEFWKEDGFTTKNEKELHGYGVKSAREVVKKYDGDLLYIMKEKKVKAVIAIKNP